MTLLYSDPLFETHRTGGGHPERPERLATVRARLAASSVMSRLTPAPFAPLAPEAISGTHAAFVVANVRDACAAGGGRIEADTVVSPESFGVGLAAAGACVSAVDAVLDGRDTNAMTLVRPPGHHATPTRSMGFCLFNNIALAANHALKRGVSRVLIVDWDVHHGNGTQDVFYADPRVTFCSIHRFGFGFYPGTGDDDETGTGPGLGHTLNAPIEAGTSLADYHAAFRAMLERAADVSRPELVLLSAGFDAHRRDPIGSLGLNTEDFIPMSLAVLDIARTHAGGRLVSCLEGGYDLDALAASVEAHLNCLCDASTAARGGVS